MFERVVRGTRHYRVHGVPPTWADVIRSIEYALERIVIFCLTTNVGDW